MGEDPRSRVETLWVRALRATRQAHRLQAQRRWQTLHRAMPGANALTLELTAALLRARGLW